MATTQESERNSYKLAQYYHNLYRSGKDGYAKRIFFEEPNIDIKVLATEYLNSHDSGFIGCTALHFAARDDRIIDVEYLLSQGANTMIKNQNGLTPLHMAVKRNCECINNFVEIKPSCKLLLSAQISTGRSGNVSDQNGLSHFHIACMADHAEAIEFFLNNGENIDETINKNSPYFPGYTPLHLAVRYCALQAVQLLLKRGADTQLKNAEGMTFLCTLLELRTKIIQKTSVYRSSVIERIEDANLKMMNFLLQSDSYVIDYAGLTLFHIACSIPELSVAKCHLQKITDINHAIDMHAAQWSGYTALHFAAYSSIEMMKMLLKNGADLQAKDAKGVTALDICIDKYGVGDIHAILFLDGNWRSILMSDRKTRLLSLIFSMKDTNLFDNFLETRVQIVNNFVPLDAAVWQGFTPLHVAVILYETNKQKDERSEHIIKKLIEKGADIDAQDIRGMSPVHLAFRRKSTNVTKRLLKFSDKIKDAVDEDNLSHLHIACKLHDKRSVEKILPTTVDVNIAFKGQRSVRRIAVGSTPIHCASSDNEVVNLLLLHGANPLLLDVNGMTAIHHSAGRSDAILSVAHLKNSTVKDSGLSHLHIAIHCENVAAVEKLLDGGADINQALLNDNVLSCIGKIFDYAAGDTPLDMALECEQMEMTELLMRRGAAVLVKDPATIEGRDLEQFVLSLDLDDDLLTRLETKIGLTMLHAACSKRDVDLIRTLLASGADVNARICVKSRLWPGYTPLHVVVNDNDHDQNIDEIVRLLIDNGADLTLTTSNPENTALYLAFYNIPRNSPSDRYSCIKILLRAHKDFAINPSRRDGLSHFHVACSIGDTITVEKFLKYGVNINQPTDFFEKRYTRNHFIPGSTPLLLVAGNSQHVIDRVSQLELVDLLLNHGANIDAEDVNGNNSLHIIAKGNCERKDVILRMVRSKVNVNSKNIQDQTPLEVLRKTNESMTVDSIYCFLEIGCVFNVFDSVTDKGLIAKALQLVSSEDRVYLIKNSLINFPHLMKIDKIGRTVIHNIVSNTEELEKKEAAISDFQYFTLFKEIEKFGCNVEAQDELGRTPLHLAVLFRNTKAISGLMMAGVDVNVTDANGETAFSYIFESCVRCLQTEGFIKKMNHNQYDHFDVFSIFVMHMKKLLLCNLDISQTNENLMFEAFEKFKSNNLTVPKIFEDQLNEIRNLEICKNTLTFGDFLSETNAVVTYSNLPQTDRYAVDQFFKHEICDFCNKYCEVAGIIFLQYRKAVKRVELNEGAQLALNVLSGFSIPDLCVMEIFKVLTNFDLSSLIEATV